MKLLRPGDLTPAERRAHDDVERPGVWRFRWMQGRSDADLASSERDVQRIGVYEEYALTQAETDTLIRRELLTIAFNLNQLTHEFLQLVGLFIPTVPISIPANSQRIACTADMQRGGIHSDPLVRLLAYRTWGERDRVWKFARHECNTLPVATKTGGRRTWIDCYIDGVPPALDWPWPDKCSMRDRVKYIQLKVRLEDCADYDP